MRGYKTYEKYKPSGEEWLGDIPEHWDVIKLKHICWRAANYGANEASDNYIQDGIRFLRTTDIDDFGRLTSENTVFIHSSAVSDYILDEGDILLSRSGTIGRSFLFSKKNHGQCAFASYLLPSRCKITELERKYVEEYFESVRKTEVETFGNNPLAFLVFVECSHQGEGDVKTEVLKDELYTLLD